MDARAYNINQSRLISQGLIDSVRALQLEASLLERWPQIDVSKWFSSDPDTTMINRAQRLNKLVDEQEALLLRGPQDAGSHAMGADELEAWIGAHCTAAQRKFAREIAAIFQYIPWSLFVDTVKRAAKLTASRILRQRVALMILGGGGLTGSKSYSFMSALFMLFLKQEGVTIDSVLYTNEPMCANTTYILFDDIAYSGNQQVNSWVSFTNRHIQPFLGALKQVCQAADLPELSALTPHAVGRIYESVGMQVIMVRAMASDTAKMVFARCPGLPFEFITGATLKSPSDVVPNFVERYKAYDNAKNAAWSNFPATSVYTDFKVADDASTFLEAFSGRVPKCPAYASMEDVERYDALPYPTTTDGQYKVVHFIGNCGGAGPDADITEDAPMARCIRPFYKDPKIIQLLQSYMTVT